jgi:integrase
VELIVAYLGFADGYYLKDGEPTSEIKTTKRALKVVRELYGRELVSKFGPLALKAVRQRMIEKDWVRTQINKNTDRIRRVFKWGESEEIVPRGVYETLRTVSGLRKGRSQAKESEPVLPVPEDVLKATLEKLSPTVRDMVLLQRYTGARPGEICNLRPGDVDRSANPWAYIPGSHKTEHYDKSRVVFIAPKGQQVLLPYLLRAADCYCFSPAEVEVARRAEQTANRKTPMSCGNRPGSNRKRKPKRRPKEKYTTTSFGQAISRASETAGLKAWTPHQLRHSYATEVRKTHGLEAVQVTLGHSQASVTEIYAERDLALASRVAVEVG